MLLPTIYYRPSKEARVLPVDDPGPPEVGPVDLPTDPDREPGP